MLIAIYKFHTQCYYCFMLCLFNSFNAWYLLLYCPNTNCDSLFSNLCVFCVLKAESQPKVEFDQTDEATCILLINRWCHLKQLSSPQSPHLRQNTMTSLAGRRAKTVPWKMGYILYSNLWTSPTFSTLGFLYTSLLPEFYLPKAQLWLEIYICTPVNSNY